MSKASKINAAQEDIHKESAGLVRNPARGSGPGPEKKADMQGAFNSKPGQMSIRGIGGKK